MAFHPNDIINLDKCVLGALKLFSEHKVPTLKLNEFERPLVVGSGNAAVTGKILFEGKDVVLADESTYFAKLKDIKGIDGGILISASGGKHAPIIAKALKKKRKKVLLVTCNKDAPAAKFADKVSVTPKQIEPYTYNTSTYMGMILSKTKEDPKKILKYLKEKVNPLLKKNFAKYDSYYIIVPDEFDNVREMFLTKFSELFGSKINGRVFTPEQTKHAKTVVPSDKELFISLGYNNKLFGPAKNRLNVPLPKWAKHATVIAIGYYIIGKIQKSHTPYFKKNILNYTKETSKIFGQEIKPIVE